MNHGRQTVECPYPGLRPFQSSEADIFFGRDEQVDQMIERLRGSSFLAVVGESGCGKSSLVYAGLIPALQAGLLKLGAADPLWRLVEMRPGAEPLNHLASSLLSAGALSRQADGLDEHAMLVAQLRRGPRGLIEAFNETPPPEGENLLILIDQFEEIFRFSRDGRHDEAVAFVNLLLETRGHPRVFVVLAMRSDFIGDCSQFLGLPEAICNSLFLVPRLSREQCRETIEGPAGRFDVRPEPSLVNQILNELGTGLDRLPLMQHALMRLWSRATAFKDSGVVVLDSDTYTQIGGIENALNLHANEVFTSLGEPQRRIAEVLFRCLSEAESGLRFTRRPTVLATVADVAETSLEELKQVVELFRAPGICFLTPPFRSGSCRRASWISAMRA